MPVASVVIEGKHIYSVGTRCQGGLGAASKMDFGGAARGANRTAILEPVGDSAASTRGVLNQAEHDIRRAIRRMQIEVGDIASTKRHVEFVSLRCVDDRVRPAVRDSHFIVEDSGSMKQNGLAIGYR